MMPRSPSPLALCIQKVGLGKGVTDCAALDLGLGSHASLTHTHTHPPLQAPTAATTPSSGRPSRPSSSINEYGLNWVLISRPTTDLIFHIECRYHHHHHLQRRPLPQLAATTAMHSRMPQLPLRQAAPLMMLLLRPKTKAQRTTSSFGAGPSAREATRWGRTAGASCIRRR